MLLYILVFSLVILWALGIFHRGEDSPSFWDDRPPL